MQNDLFGIDVSKKAIEYEAEHENEDAKYKKKESGKVAMTTPANENNKESEIEVSQRRSIHSKPSPDNRERFEDIDFDNSSSKSDRQL